jgi:23S rRNA pseudouridine2605 synthase
MRLVRYLAEAGAASRRASAEIIKAGRVTVNAQSETDPARELTGRENVQLDGRLVRRAQHEYYAVHKPAGVVSTVRDTHGRSTVVSLVESPARLYPVGRLDADTTGLILLTNDGELANRLTHPRYEVPKTYRVVAQGRLGRIAVKNLREGVPLSDGLTAPAEVRVVGQTNQRSELLITIREGRNRQIRRMCEAVGHPVLSLSRVKFGPLALGRLASGRARALKPAEVTALRQAGKS